MTTINNMLESGSERNDCKQSKKKIVYKNPWSTWSDEIFSKKFMVYHFLHRSEPHCKPKINCPNLNSLLPVLIPKFQADITEESIRMTWLGHATVLIYIDGVHVLCDPIFSERCSILRHAGGFKRYRPAPCMVKNLPRIDFVVISHNHHDHLDMPTLEQLAMFHPTAVWCVPRGDKQMVYNRLKNSLKPQNILPNVVDFVWWESKKLHVNVNFVFLPTQHWSGRNLLRNKCTSLWGSWALLGKKHRAWFAGDTGYCEVFKEIGDRFGPFDLSAIPIGSYHPRWFLKYQHIDPGEAVQVHKDVKSVHSVGIHWGTYAFTWESYMRPKEDLDEALAKSDMLRETFRTIHHGQSLVIKRHNGLYKTYEE